MNSDLILRVVQAIADESIMDLTELAHKVVDQERRSGHNKLADQLDEIIKTKRPKNDRRTSANKSVLKELPVSADIKRSS